MTHHEQNILPSPFKRHCVTFATPCCEGASVAFPTDASNSSDISNRQQKETLCCPPARHAGTVQFTRINSGDLYSNSGDILLCQIWQFSRQIGELGSSTCDVVSAGMCNGTMIDETVHLCCGDTLWPRTSTTACCGTEFYRSLLGRGL